MTSTDTLGYYRDRADQAMRRAGASAFDATQIAQWASQHHKQFRYGIIVDSAGRIVAQTVRQGFDPEADYIDRLYIDDAPAGVDTMEAGLAQAILSRHLGRPLVHLTATQLTTGPGHN